MFRWLLPLLFFALLALDTWGSARCAPVGAPAFQATELPTASPTSYTRLNDGRASGWFRFTNADYWGWYRGNTVLGRWHTIDQTWEEWTGRAWLPPSPAPWLKPEQLPGARPDRGGVNYGLDTSRLMQHGERFLIGGEPVERWEVEASIGDFKDDSKLPQVLVLDPDKKRREEAYAALATSLAGKARVNAADPSSKDQLPFLVGFKLDQDKRFQAAGAATFIQAPRDPKDGCAKVVSAVYQALPAAQLTAEVGARINPTYDPSKNPSDPSGGAGLSLNWKWLWEIVLYPLLLLLMGGGAGAYVARPGKTGEDKGEPEKQGPPTDSPAAMLVRAVEQYKAAEADESARLANRMAQLTEEKALVKTALAALAK
jgi:hypothetical protein